MRAACLRERQAIGDAFDEALAGGGGEDSVGGELEVEALLLQQLPRACRVTVILGEAIATVAHV